MKLYVVILALVVVAYSVPVENQQDDFESANLIPVDNVIETVQTSENRDDIPVKRDKRHFQELHSANREFSDAMIDLQHKVVSGISSVAQQVYSGTGGILKHVPGNYDAGSQPINVRWHSTPGGHVIVYNGSGGNSNGIEERNLPGGGIDSGIGHNVNGGNGNQPNVQVHAIPGGHAVVSSSRNSGSYGFSYGSGNGGGYGGGISGGNGDGIVYSSGSNNIAGSDARGVHGDNVYSGTGGIPKHVPGNYDAGSQPINVRRHSTPGGHVIVYNGSGGNSNGIEERNLPGGGIDSGIGHNVNGGNGNQPNVQVHAIPGGHAVVSSSSNDGSYSFSYGSGNGGGYGGAIVGGNGDRIKNSSSGGNYSGSSKPNWRDYSDGIDSGNGRGVDVGDINNGNGRGNKRDNARGNNGIIGSGKGGGNHLGDNGNNRVHNEHDTPGNVRGNDGANGSINNGGKGGSNHYGITPRRDYSTVNTNYNSPKIF